MSPNVFLHILLVCLITTIFGQRQSQWQHQQQHAARPVQISYTSLIVDLDALYTRKPSEYMKIKWETNFVITSALPSETETQVYHQIIKNKLAKKDCIVGAELGRGGFGIVFRGKYGKYAVAIKLTRPVTSMSDKLFDFTTKKSCCLSKCDPKCNGNYLSIGSVEAAGLILSKDISGVTQIRAFGIVVDAYTGKLLYFITVMDYVEESVTIKSFVDNCFKKHNVVSQEKVLSFIRRLTSRVHQINKQLLEIGIYHNDLKHDNLLLTLELDNKVIKTENHCSLLINHKTPRFHIYFIDFGNAVLNIRFEKSVIMNYETGSPYFKRYIAPELITPKASDILVLPLLSWYHGVIAFEICAKIEDSFQQFTKELNDHTVKFETHLLTRCFTDKELMDFIEKTLQLIPSRRIEFFSIPKHPFVNKLF